MWFRVQLIQTIKLLLIFPPCAGVQSPHQSGVSARHSHQQGLRPAEGGSSWQDTSGEMFPPLYREGLQNGDAGSELRRKIAVCNDGKPLQITCGSLMLLSFSVRSLCRTTRTPRSSDPTWALLCCSWRSWVSTISCTLTSWIHLVSRLLALSPFHT